MNDMEPAAIVQDTLKKNGLRVLLIASESETFHIQLSMKVGMFSEGEKEYEFAHFLEHLNAQFTSRRYPIQQEVISKIESYGVDWNAFTSTRNTGYYIKGFSSVDWKTDPNSKLMDLSGIMASSYFDFLVDDDIFMQEINAVKQELCGYESSPDTLISETHNSQMYPGHPASVTIVDRLNNMRNNAGDTLKFKKKILEFRSKYYGPKNSLLTIAVPVSSRENAKDDLKEFLQMIQKSQWNEKWPSKETEILDKDLVMFKPNLKKEESKNGKESESTITQIYSSRGIRSTVLVSMKIHGITHKDRIEKVAIRFICFLLTSGFDSRLIKKLRTEKGLIYSIHAYPDYDRYDSNLNSLNIQTSCDSDNAAETHQLIIEQLKELASNPELISKDQLSAFKATEKFKFQDARYNKNPSKWVDSYGTDILFGDQPHTFTQAYDELNSLTLKIVKKVLKENLFDNGELYITFNAPKKADRSQEGVEVKKIYQLFVDALKKERRLAQKNEKKLSNKK
jgi:predicted Zn-dependent peptidase